MQVEQHLNLFWLKKFHFIFWLKAAGADLWKNLKKIYFENPPNFIFNCKSRPWKCKRTAFESILVEKVSFIFWLKAAGADLWKNQKKYILKIHKFYAHLQKQAPENANEKHWQKVSFHFWHKAVGADLWKSLKKIIFWKSPNFMFNSNSRPWKFLVEKVFISFFGSRPQARTCEKFWKKYILKIHQFYVQYATAGPENAREQNSNRFWLKKFPFIFWLKAAGADLWKNLKKIYFENPQILCSIATAGPENAREQNSNRFWLKKFPFIFWLKAAGADLWKVLKKIYFENPPNFMFNSNSRPWKCKRTEFESILVEKVSFHFLAQGRRRGPVKSSEKNIFWKSTNFMFICKSRPWKCKRTAFESILAEKVSFHFLALGRRRGPVKKSEKNIFWKSTNFMFNSNSRPWKCKRTEFESILVEKVSFHFLAQGRRRGPAKSSEKIYFENPPNFMFNSNSRPWKCKRTEFESILVEKVSFHFLAQGRRRGPAKSSEKNIFWKSTNFMFICKSRPWKCKRTALWIEFWLKKFHFIFLA